jgi:predicted Zn-dependent protease with MMP-like domain
MDRERFEGLVKRAVEALPDEFSARMENIDVVVEDWPSRSQLAGLGLRYRHELLGLYQGVPLTKRGGRYGLVPPDKITIFQGSIEVRYRDDARITALIGRVVRHEIAHHFGISDGRLKELEGDEDY